MEIVKRLEEIPSSFKLGLILGNFDGVHLGHQFILEQVKEGCRARGAKICVITFAPHPLLVLNEHKNFLIMTANQKREALQDLGVDYLIEMAFSKKLSQQAPEEFLANNLFPVSNINCFFLGYDFRFGAERAGDFHTVEKFVKDKNISLFQLEKYVSLDKITPSSTLIREKIKCGYIDAANALLGRIFKLEGTVVQGDGRGRTIGYPTANLKYSQDNIVPLVGVYKTNALVKGLKYRSITNIGYNPTFTGARSIRVETHILDFEDNIYGETVELEFLGRLRDEMKFNGREELILQIEKDIAGIYS